MNNKCDHVWKKSGTWNGKTPDRIPTGGTMYVCEKCGDKAENMEVIKGKGGTVTQDTDIYGRPKIPAETPPPIIN